MARLIILKRARIICIQLYCRREHWRGFILADQNGKMMKNFKQFAFPFNPMPQNDFFCGLLQTKFTFYLSERNGRFFAFGPPGPAQFQKIRSISQSLLHR